MRPRDHEQVDAWLRKVRQDIEAARLVLAHSESLNNIVCFHCQQAAEKMLKAVLVALDRNVPRTHDLVDLLQRIEVGSGDRSALLPDALHLNRYSVLPRYPSIEGEETTSRAREALTRAESLLAALDALWNDPD